MVETRERGRWVKKKPTGRIAILCAAHMPHICKNSTVTHHDDPQRQKISQNLFQPTILLKQTTYLQGNLLSEAKQNSYLVRACKQATHFVSKINFSSEFRIKAFSEEANINYSHLRLFFYLKTVHSSVQMNN